MANWVTLSRKGLIRSKSILHVIVGKPLNIQQNRSNNFRSPAEWSFKFRSALIVCKISFTHWCGAPLEMFIKFDNQILRKTFINPADRQLINSMTTRTTVNTSINTKHEDHMRFEIWFNLYLWLLTSAMTQQITKQQMGEWGMIVKHAMDVDNQKWHFYVGIPIISVDNSKITWNDANDMKMG